MPIKWTNEKHEQLLVCILPYLKGLDYEVIANKMGSDCTGEAVRQHLAKLKKDAEARDGDSATPALGKPAPKSARARKAKTEEEDSPVKRKRGRPAKSVKTEKTITEDSEGDDEKENVEA